MLSKRISSISLLIVSEMTENLTMKYVKIFVLCDPVDINSGRTHVIVSVLVLHVTCLFCKLCNFFGVSVKINVLNMKLECIQSLDY